MMIRNYLKIAFRNLVKHKANTIINLLGLTVAFTNPVKSLRSE